MRQQQRTRMADFSLFLVVVAMFIAVGTLTALELTGGL